jgi:SAM-dependent methyltransferase
VNAYGRQKIAAEEAVEKVSGNWTIVRPTFVLGIRPLPMVGRQNPAEQMLEHPEAKQVIDYWFSVAFARDVARELWKIAMCEPQMKKIHIGNPNSVNRWQIAWGLTRKDVPMAMFADFPGLAPRPVNTTYGETFDGTKEIASTGVQELQDGLVQCCADFEARENLTLPARARELSLFTGMREEDCRKKLETGFGALHAEVAADFRRDVPYVAGQEPDEGALLDWYRKTTAYCWELSAYHCDAKVQPPGFNYSGMCKGIGDRLLVSGAKRVLVLGDGIGDLTLSLLRRGFDAIYHDLEGSRTAKFAGLRLWMYTGKYPEMLLTEGWQPDLGCEQFDAVCAADFLEHCPSVETFVLAIKRALKPGGLLFSQNAFACGSGVDGSIPMHLKCNDRFEKDWDPFLFSIGFTQESSNWYRSQCIFGSESGPVEHLVIKAE